jgi:hypothetical protein
VQIISVQHRPLIEVLEGQSLSIEADIYTVGMDLEAELHLRRRGDSEGVVFPMKRLSGYRYLAEVSGDSWLLQAGPIEYQISVTGGQSVMTFPSSQPGKPGEWDFGGEKVWSAIVQPPGVPLVLFDADRDFESFLFPYTEQYGEYAVDLTTGDDPSRLAAQLRYDSFVKGNRRIAVRTELDSTAFPGRFMSVSADSILIIGASSCKNRGVVVEISITSSEGHAWGSSVEFSEQNWTEVKLPASQLQRKPLALLPKAHSSIQDDFYSESNPAWPASFRDVDKTTINGIQVIARHEQPNDQAFEAGCWVRLSRVLIN